MALAGLLGVTIDIEKVKADDVNEDDTSLSWLLFSESPSRFLLEVAPEQQAAFEAYLLDAGVSDFAQIGSVTETEGFVVRYGEETLIDIAVDDVQRAWKGEREDDDA